MVKKNTSDSDEDETFYYRYTSVAPPPPSAATTAATSKSSGTLAPSKSTLYVSNLDFTLTNSDLHTLFSTFGKLARVSVLKDRHSRQSRGVAFIQFVSRDDALAAARHMDKKILNGRTLSASIAVDNGRAAEFIKKRVYKDKTRCYECGDCGHLSYECPKNQLGPRERPVAKRVRRGFEDSRGKGEDQEDEEEGEGEGAEEENWASVVDDGADERLLKGGVGGSEEGRRKVKKASYFSDESDEDE
ncbi:Zinc finger CCHC-type and RNA-binding motif-containing protein 1 [Euphorbia peplus]|nr:Zinc finger CCHC-type and RNA-binding motif-containing protein 1 [Euphorbia peplus]